MTGGESNKGTKEGAAAEEKETSFEISRLEFGGREETKSVVANLMLSLRSAAFNGNWGESGSNISASHIPTLISIWIELNIVLRCDSGPHPKIAFMPGQSATFESPSHPCINRFSTHIFI